VINQDEAIEEVRRWLKDTAFMEAYSSLRIIVQKGRIERIEIIDSYMTLQNIRDEADNR